MAQSDYPELRSIFDKHREVVKMMRAEKKLDSKLIHFKAVYCKLGKKIGENKEIAKINSFANIIIGRYELNEPDSITITWLQADNESKLYEHTFNISPKKQYQLVEAKAQEVSPSTQSHASFQGFGEVEINQIVERRLTDMRRTDEYEKLKEDYQLISQKNRELEELNIELEKDKSAKETTENYMRIIGMALPGLSKFFGGASILSMLAGTEEDKQIESKSAAKDEREEMIQLLHDFMQSDLNEQEVATLYMLFMEIQKDKNQIQYLLTQLTKGNQHATTL